MLLRWASMNGATLIRTIYCSSYADARHVSAAFAIRSIRRTASDGMFPSGVFGRVLASRTCFVLLVTYSFRTHRTLTARLYNSKLRILVQSIRYAPVCGLCLRLIRGSVRHGRMQAAVGWTG